MGGLRPPRSVRKKFTSAHVKSDREFRTARLPGGYVLRRRRRRRSSFVVCRSSFVVRRSSFVVRRSSLAVRQEQVCI